MIHFMLAELQGRGVVSAEITAFRRRRPNRVPAINSAVSEVVFGHAGLKFESPNVELAKILSSITAGAALYLAYEDALGEAAYVGFVSGGLVTYETVGWAGTDTYLRHESVTPSPGGVSQRDLLRRASRCFGWDLGLELAEDLHTCFYENPHETFSYVLGEARQPLQKPRRA